MDLNDAETNDTFQLNASIVFDCRDSKMENKNRFLLRLSRKPIGYAWPVGRTLYLLN